ncbi:hypothetical protein ACJROX_05800 [Pseudalkalibacillus sp. A8]|uniref:hypothetical protein n=1 Tax=Pseudalkalibacillus sp. A8 TaxID=3382641 RepID=UPI0038B67D62
MEKGKITGTFTQSGQSFPFELEKGDGTAEQPDENEDLLTIETPEGTLYGSLMASESNEPSPIALIIPGSGPTDRNVPEDREGNLAMYSDPSFPLADG